MASLIKLPPQEMNLGDVESWTDAFINNSQYGDRITMQTLLNTKNPRPDILKVLLSRLRKVVHSVKFVKTSVLRGERTEASMRAEVHDHPEEFNFVLSELVCHHPYHLAEMIQIIIGMLEKQGVSAKVRSNPVQQMMDIN